MRNILQTLKLDFYIIKGYSFRFLIIAYVIGIAIGILSKAAYLTVPLVMILTAVSSGTYFSVREKNNLGKLYGVLPTDRAHVVLARYLYTLIFGLINWAVAILLGVLFITFTGKATDVATFSMFASFAFFYFCLFSGISFPLFYKFEYSRAYVITSLPFYLVFIIGLVVMRSTGFAASLPQTFQFLAANLALVWVLGVGVGLAILIVSCLVSVSIYKKKEL